MECPRCRSDNTARQVIDSRPVVGLVRRLRRCGICGHKWSTVEVPSEVKPCAVHGQRHSQPVNVCVDGYDDEVNALWC